MVTATAPHRSGLPPLELERWVPFCRPALLGNELAYLRDAVESGHLSGNGAYTLRCEALLSQLLAGARVLLTTSGTHALETAALLLEIGPGDEVIVPSFTFVSTANAFALRGARIVFADIRPDTLNLDERHLPALLSGRTRAIVPVHYGGVGCAMAAILSIAQKAGLDVVEDNAHGLFGEYGGRPLGTCGVMSALSFHETKNVFCGEGGALVLNDPALLDRAEILREKGTDRSRFFRGEVDRYSWLDIGSSWVLADPLAAFLLAQLEQRERVQATRKRLWHRYLEELGDWAGRRGVQLPHVPSGCVSSYHVFHVVVPTAADQPALIEHLRRRGVQAVFHYLPLHLSPMGRALGGRPGDCPVTESVSARLVRLPLFATMSDAEQAQVIAALQSF